MQSACNPIPDSSLINDNIQFRKLMSAINDILMQCYNECLFEWGIEVNYCVDALTPKADDAKESRESMSEYLSHLTCNTKSAREKIEDIIAFSEGLFKIPFPDLFMQKFRDNLKKICDKFQSSQSETPAPSVKL